MPRGAPRPEDKSEHTKQDRHQSPDLNQHMVTRPRVTSDPTPHRTIRYRPKLFNPLWGAVLAKKVYWLGVLVRVSVLIVGAPCCCCCAFLLLLIKKKKRFYCATRPLLRPLPTNARDFHTQEEGRSLSRRVGVSPRKKKKRDPEQTKTGIIHTPALECGMDRWMDGFFTTLFVQENQGERKE